ncbi:MAG: DUF1266 domain-containing protein [Prevotellaceae bacterium]|jgi:hypothetical protein|nr:DUF1266 domain-containing protein [Prevotellaceae bacterium]
MKLKSIFLSLIALGFVLSAVSCGESGDKTIKNEKLHPFLLSGVYTLGGYGGPSTLFSYVEQYATAQPGSSSFLKQMSEAYEEYFVFPYGTDSKREYQNALEDWWGIENKEEFMETQEELLTNYHQASYEKVRKALDENGGASADLTAIDLNKYGLDEEDALADLRFVRDNYGKFSKAGIKAWDIVRYVNNVNFAHAAGYLNDSEAMEMAKKALTEAQKYYDSWTDYFNDYNLGRGFWGGDNSAEFDRIVSGILDKENVYNIYNYMGIK